MSRTRLPVSLIGIAVLLIGIIHLALARPRVAAPAMLTQERLAEFDIKAPRREPINVPGNVQESKLIQKVEPIYPEQAKAEGIPGRVILLVTINEEGQVWDVKVAQGHPLLDQAAVSAVRQWRYRPTTLHGEPVPVIATVVVILKVEQGDVNVEMDESGKLAGTSVDSANQMTQMLQGAGTIHITIAPATPIRVAEATVRDLLQSGAQNLKLWGAYCLYQGRLFYVWNETLIPPTVAIDRERLRVLAKSLVTNWTESSVLAYFVYVSETGEIVGLQQLSGPQIPEVEKELMRVPVLSPGRRGADPVPVRWTIPV
jgi:TonB family protein